MTHVPDKRFFLGIVVEEGLWLNEQNKIKQLLPTWPIPSQSCKGRLVDFGPNFSIALWSNIWYASLSSKIFPAPWPKAIAFAMRASSKIAGRVIA